MPHWDARTDLAQQALNPSICVRCNKPVELISDGRITLIGPKHESCEINFLKSVSRGLDRLEDLDTEMLADWAADLDNEYFKNIDEVRE